MRITRSKPKDLATMIRIQSGDWIFCKLEYKVTAEWVARLT